MSWLIGLEEKKGLTSLLSFFKPSLLFHPYTVLMTLGYSLGWINSYIVLGLFCIVILQPIAFIMRAVGYGQIKIKKLSQKSYREDKQNHSTDLKRIC